MSGNRKGGFSCPYKTLKSQWLFQAPTQANAHPQTMHPKIERPGINLTLPDADLTVCRSAIHSAKALLSARTHFQGERVGNLHLRASAENRIDLRP